MATVREGNNAALVVVDVQVGVMKDAWDASRVIGNIALAVTRARVEGIPVIWVQHGDEDLPMGSAPWQWVPELVPADGEFRIYKEFNSSFEQTALEAELAALGVTHIVLAGAATNWCIRATAYAAIERGYDLTLVSDAHTTESLEPGDGANIQAGDLVGELNLAIQWLSYPGRKNGIARAAQVDFSTPGGELVVP